MLGNGVGTLKKGGTPNCVCIIKTNLELAISKK